LDAVLTHELGHVFGIPHSISGIMQSTTCETSVTKTSQRQLENLEKMPQILKYFGVANLRQFLDLQMEDLFSIDHFSVSGSVGSFEKAYNFQGFIDGKEDTVKIEFRDRQLKFSSLSVPKNNDPQIGYNFVRDLVFGVQHIDYKYVDAGQIEIRIPKNQKIMKFNSSMPLGDDETTRYFTLGLIDLKSIVVSAEITADGEKAVVTLLKADPAFVSRENTWEVWSKHRFVDLYNF
jgi:hypothetical protein